MTARVRASSSFRRRVFERLEAVQKREREKESERGAFFCPSLFAFVSFFFEFCFFLSLSLLPSSSLLSFVDFFCLSIFFFRFRGRLLRIVVVRCTKREKRKREWHTEGRGRARLGKEEGEEEEEEEEEDDDGRHGSVVLRG